MTKEYYLIMFSGRHSALGIPGSLPWLGIQIPLFALFRRWTIIFLYVPRLRSPSTAALYSVPLVATLFFPMFSPQDAAEARLKSYLEAARLSNKTLYSFRYGGAITMALT